jgi:hypothetical protein
VGLFLCPKTKKEVLDMAITLEQQRLASNDQLQRGVIELLERTNPILQRLPFREITGNSYSYRIETDELGSVQFRSVNEPYIEDTAVFDRRTANLSILGGEAFVDRYLTMTSPLADLRAEQLAIKTKLIGRRFTNEFLNGNATNDPEGFDGLSVLTLPEQTMDMADAEITLQDMHELMDLVPNANMIITSRTGRRQLQRLMDLTPSLLTIGEDSFGAKVQQFSGITIAAVDDDLLPSRPAAVTGTVNDIYLVELAEDGVCGIQNAEGVSVRDLGEIDERPGFLTRVEFYCSVMNQRPKALGRMTNALQV